MSDCCGGAQPLTHFRAMGCARSSPGTEVPCPIPTTPARYPTSPDAAVGVGDRGRWRGARCCEVGADAGLAPAVFLLGLLVQLGIELAEQGLEFASLVADSAEFAGEGEHTCSFPVVLPVGEDVTGVRLAVWEEVLGREAVVQAAAVAEGGAVGDDCPGDAEGFEVIDLGVESLVPVDFHQANVGGAERAPFVTVGAVPPPAQGAGFGGAFTQDDSGGEQ